MIQFENSYQHNSPLSPEVMMEFHLACGRLLHFFGSKPTLAELSVSTENELRVLPLESHPQSATHMDSGTLLVPKQVDDGSDLEVRVWTQTEGARPKDTMLCGEPIQIASACRDDWYDYSTDRIIPHDYVSSTSGRLFEIIKRIDADGTAEISAGEINDDEQVDDIVYSLIRAERILKK